MEYDFKSGKLTVYLPVRIDTANARAVEHDLAELVEELAPASVVMDAKGMQYICSAGLRIILNIRKKVPDTEVINASSVVYDIFVTTGFNIVLKITKVSRRKAE